MARPKKQEVDYFPHYCEHGKVLFIVESKWGNNGYAFFYKLCELLGKKEGHAYNCKEPGSWEYLLAKTLFNEQDAVDILSKLSELKVINSDLWAEKIIWMQSFVDSISDVYSRRTVSKPLPPALLHTETPLSGITSADNPQSKVKESKVKEKYSANFETFYKSYPKKKAHDKAWEAWKKRNVDLPEIEILLEAINNQKKSEDWKKENGRFIPYPATWINEGRWADEVEIKKPQGSW